MDDDDKEPGNEPPEPARDAAQEDGAKLRKVSEDELEQILAAHETWVETDGKEGEQADLSRANLGAAKLGGSNLQGAKLGGTNLQGANLDNANLQGANLVSADLREAYLGNANLQEANLGHANLQGAELIDANLRKALLLRANLQGAILFSANLQGADLRDTDLLGANLQDANLQGADLRGVLQGAGIYEAERVTREQLDAACGDDETKLPYYLPDYQMKPCPTPEQSPSN